MSDRFGGKHALEALIPGRARAYGLVSVADYKTLREILIDKRQQDAVQALALKNSN